MTLKERLDAVWQHNEIACPCHLVRWNESIIGYSRYSEFGLFFTKGKLIGPKKLKTKGKGWTWIFKGYGFISRNSYAR